MGQEIAATAFTEADFTMFRARLVEETALLRRWFAQGRLSREGPRTGFELEAWLIDRNCFPAPHNQAFLARLADPLVVPELSRFNIELNGPPRLLAGDGLAAMEADLAATWQRCVRNAHADVDTAIAIGTLPTLRESDLSLAMMTPSNRYAALNAEMQRQRGGRPVTMDIDCADPAGAHLRSTHTDVMLEAATTSFQVHLQVPWERISATLNASLILSGPLVALSANSPFLFGKPLWHETRIPVFEQAFEDGADLRRVTFGSGYAGADPTAIFAENLEGYPLLLPLAGDAAPERLSALRLHNGTIWRWNRLLAGTDEDGTPHLRIEQRVMPAGPSVMDMLANAAFYLGAAHMLAKQAADGEGLMPFERARANFHACAKCGIDAEISWLDGRMHPVRAVLAGLAKLAREGLAEQGASDAVIDRYIDVIDLRIASGRNGAAWQLAHFARHADLFRLTADYLEHQRSGMPVHEWSV